MSTRLAKIENVQGRRGSFKYFYRTGIALLHLSSSCLDLGVGACRPVAALAQQKLIAKTHLSDETQREEQPSSSSLLWVQHDERQPSAIHERQPEHVTKKNTRGNCRPRASSQLNHMCRYEWYVYDTDNMIFIYIYNYIYIIQCRYNYIYIYSCNPWFANCNSIFPRMGNFDRIQLLYISFSDSLITKIKYTDGWAVIAIYELPDDTPLNESPPHLQTTCRWESTDFLWKREVGGSKNLPGGVAFIQNGHGFANVPRQSLSLLCHYLHKRHDYFVTCCFHAIHDLQTATQFFLEWGISIGYNSCTYRSQTHLSQK